MLFKCSLNEYHKLCIMTNYYLFLIFNELRILCTCNTYEVYRGSTICDVRTIRFFILMTEKQNIRPQRVDLLSIFFCFNKLINDKSRIIDWYEFQGWSSTKAIQHKEVCRKIQFGRTNSRKLYEGRI